MSLLFTNNAVSTLAAGISDTDLTLVVQAADGLLYPNPSGNDSFLVTLRDASNNIEIVEVTNKAADTFTIVRGQEGTVAKAYLSGDAVELSVTAGVLSQYRQGVGDGVVDVAINTAVGLSRVHDYINCTAAVTLTLADAATMAEGYQVTAKNSSTGNVTISRATGGDTIDGVVGDFILVPGATIYLSVNENETGYITMFNGAAGAYPVGAVFFSAVATDPSLLLGFGTWVAIPGRFVVGVGDNGDGKSYAALEEGGQKDQSIIDHDHLLTDPGHAHSIRTNEENSKTGPRVAGMSRADLATGATTQSATTGINVGDVDPAGTAAAETIVAAGEDINLPPFIGMYIWRRTA